MICRIFDKAKSELWEGWLIIIDYGDFFLEVHCKNYENDDNDDNDDTDNTDDTDDTDNNDDNVYDEEEVDDDEDVDDDGNHLSFSFSSSVSAASRAGGRRLSLTSFCSLKILHHHFHHHHSHHHHFHHHRRHHSHHHHHLCGCQNICRSLGHILSSEDLIFCANPTQSKDVLAHIQMSSSSDHHRIIIILWRKGNLKMYSWQRAAAAAPTPVNVNANMRKMRNIILIYVFKCTWAHPEHPVRLESDGVDDFSSVKIPQ